MLHVQPWHSTAVDCIEPAIFILHGMFGSGDNWMSIARELGAIRRVFTIDLPGHGESRNELGNLGEQAFRYANMAGMVEEAIRNVQGSRPIILLGHSMGGKTAMMLTLARPDLVDSLVVADTAPRSYISSGFNQEVLEMLSVLDLSSIGSRLELDGAMKPWIGDAVMRGFMLKSLVPRENGGWKWRFDQEAILAGAHHIADWPALAPESRYSGPVLFLKGELSPYIIPERDMPLILPLFPAAKLAAVGKARHWVHFDNRTEFVALLNAFLA